MRPPDFESVGIALWAGDCIELMAELEDASVDAIVCDPPYGLEFMGKAWDKAASPAAFAAWCTTWAVEALRVLKPGGHLLAFGGTRTFHRLTCGIEDAGFEIRDCLSWLYGSGFPKSLNVSKAIDKAAGAKREVVGHADPSDPRTAMARKVYGNHMQDGAGEGVPITAPATDAARQWQGWGTALKPAWEPCVVARKPLAGTVAANVQQYGTGAVNVDGCRVAGPMDGVWGTSNATVDRDRKFNASPDGADYRTAPHTAGRWPANVVLDEDAAALLDSQSGERGGGNGLSIVAGAFGKHGRYGKASGAVTASYADTGGASRFFYCAKASKRDRGEGNTHPTVKPSALMRWLVRMVTPPGGTVLDPFAGSGTTLMAARDEGFRAIGIEREPEYVEIIRQRVAARLT